MNSRGAVQHGAVPEATACVLPPLSGDFRAVRVFTNSRLQDEHMHALLHGQAVSSSSMEKYGDKDSDSGDITPKYTGVAIWKMDMICCSVGRRSGDALYSVQCSQHGSRLSSSAFSLCWPSAQPYLLCVLDPRRRDDRNICALAKLSRFALMMHVLCVHAAKQPRSDLEMGPLDRLGNSSGVRGRRPQQQQPAGEATAPCVPCQLGFS